ACDYRLLLALPSVPTRRSSDLHILAGAVLVGDLARLVSFQEQELAGSFIGIDFCRQRRGVGKFQRHMAFPLRLERGHIDDDAARSEEHTSELQSRENLVCRLLL